MLLKKRKENFTLFSDDDVSLLRQQLRAQCSLLVPVRACFGLSGLSDLLKALCFIDCDASLDES